MEKENVIPFYLNIPVTPSPRKHSLDSPQKKRLTGRKSKSNESPTKSPSRAPIANKISFFERQDCLNSPLSESSLSWAFPEVKAKIEFYEKLFMGTPMKGQRRDVVIKHDEWKKMMSELLGQVQEKAAQLKSYEDKAAQNEEHAASSIASLKEEELKERLAELEKENGVLAAQAAQDKHYSMCAEDKVEQLMVDLISEQEKLAGEQERLVNEQEKLAFEQERSRLLQEELETRNNEIEKMAKKLISRNAELKLYKSKVEHFLGLLETRTATPNKKRMSICSESSTSSSASKKPRPSPAFSCPSPRFDYKFDPTRYETK